MVRDAQLEVQREEYPQAGREAAIDKTSTNTPAGYQPHLLHHWIVT